jgi:hypothetical protein
MSRGTKTAKNKCDVNSLYDAYVGKYKPGMADRMRDECVNDPEGCEVVRDNGMHTCLPKGQQHDMTYHDQPIRNSFKSIWRINFNSFSELILGMYLNAEEQEAQMAEEGEAVFFKKHSILTQKIWNVVIAPMIRAQYEENYIQTIPFRSDIIRWTQATPEELKMALTYYNNTDILPTLDVNTPEGFAQAVAFLSGVDAIQKYMILFARS